MKLSDRLRASAHVAAALGLGTALSLGATAAAAASSTSASPNAAARLIAAEAAGSAHASQPAATAANSRSTSACPAVIVVGRQSCFALKRSGIHPAAAGASPNAIPAGVGYGPTQLQSAYNLTSTAASSGAGRTIALVDAFDYPSAASDLASYRSAAGLPAANFAKVNQNGQASPLPAAASPNDDWTVEAALDMDMASAVCPLCNIVLVEAQDDSSNGLFIAQNAAANMAGFISDSWGGSESASETSMDTQFFTHNGVVTTASAGDSDFAAGVIYPAASPLVVSVGGTSLSTASNSRGWSESVWNTSQGAEGTGSGCSTVEPKPSWQAALSLPAGCNNRIDNDVAADADPNTGVAVFDTFNGNGGWIEVGGTSASSPMLAAMYALGGNAGATPANDIYTHTANFFDVTSGNDGTCSPAYLCTAGTGYDGPTGIGTPNGVAGLQTGGGGGNTVSVTNPGNQTGTVGTAVSLQIRATDSASGQTLAFSATGLPAGLAISTSGLITGTPTTAGTSSVSVKATDGTGASGSASFTWTVNPAGGAGGNVIVNGGFETGSLSGWTASGPATGVTTSGPHSGKFAAMLGSTSPTNGASNIAQTFTAASGDSHLSFWFNVTCPDTVTFDWATATLRDNTTGTTTTVLAKTCVANSGWVQKTATIVAGHSYTLTLTSKDDNFSGDPTFTKYDDVSTS